MIKTTMGKRIDGDWACHVNVLTPGGNRLYGTLSYRDLAAEYEDQLRNWNGCSKETLYADTMLMASWHVAEGLLMADFAGWNADMLQHAVDNCTWWVVALGQDVRESMKNATWDDWQEYSDKRETLEAAMCKELLFS